MSEQTPKDDAPKGERIAKAIARAGLCSRREAEALIAQGRVFVNGKRLTTPAHNVTAADEILVDNKKLAKPERPRLFRFHKPRGVLVATRDPGGRPTIYDGMPPELPRLMPVGRLDFNSEGLLLLTNDGAIKRHLELPATGIARKYRVRVYGVVDPRRLAALKNGTTIDGVTYGSIDARLEGRPDASNAWLTFALAEGKNREIRRVCESMGLQVNRLIRTHYGVFELDKLGKGDIEEVGPGELRKVLGALAGAPLKLGGRPAS
ncbi:MAG: rRNA pseudouridine synthase [Azospirillum sp.]|jgi:23S rRNA pseudouridine2605 synthase|nr:rRNA pseudouridine synthase [Azospirillum sp.]MCA3264540.1 rRNA pseudouridine synthase [Azospirillum sp.]MCZ8121997.1 pseudouridine synthase [Magnetospirillum sp.]